MTKRLPPDARRLIAKMEADVRFVATVILIAILVVSLGVLAAWNGRNHFSAPGMTTAALKSDRL